MISALTISLALLCFGGGLYALFFRRKMQENIKVEARLGQMVGEMSSVASRDTPVLFSGFPDMTRLLPEIAKNRLYQAGITLTPDRMAGITVAAIFAWLLLGVIFGFAISSAVLLLLLLGAMAVIDHRARKRMNELADAMLGYFDRVRQLLVVGNSLAVALSKATNSSPPIVIEFFSPAIRRIANGAGVAESINQLADELDLYELRLFGVAIETNLRFGGSLTSILANLIDNIRRRAAIIRELRVSTSQIRLSAWILGILPIAVAAGVMAQSPEYILWFVEEPTGRKMLIFCAIAQLLGAIAMRKISRADY